MYQDLVIADLANEVAASREAVRQLVDLIADLAFENACLRVVRDPMLDRLHRRLSDQLDRLDVRELDDDPGAA